MNASQQKASLKPLKPPFVAFLVRNPLPRLTFWRRGFKDAGILKTYSAY